MMRERLSKKDLGPGVMGLIRGISTGRKPVLALMLAATFLVNGDVLSQGMVIVPAGVFIMGDASPGDPGEGFAEERPLHTVGVSLFYMDQFEVSNSLWNSVRDWALLNGYTDLPAGETAPSAADFPVTGVSWYDCIKWCNARSEMESRGPAYYTDPSHTQVYRNGDVDIAQPWVDWESGGYRLPTEAEWEYAARGGLSGSVFPWLSVGGSYIDHLDGSRANYYNSGDPMDNGSTPCGYYNGSQTPAGGVMDNGYRLFDMAGNVEEWCWDWFDSDYYSAYPSNAWPSNPRGPESPEPHGSRTARGGSWNSDGFDLRCSFRDPVQPDTRDATIGLRTVRGVTATVVTVYNFSVTEADGGAIVAWNTGCEPQTIGFHVYRQQADGIWKEISPGLIPAKGFPEGGVGASYSLLDPEAVGGASYTYKVVAIEKDGSTETIGPIEETVYRLRITALEYAEDGLIALRWSSRSGAWYKILTASAPDGRFEVLARGIRGTPPENMQIISTDGVSGLVLFKVVEEE
jgi:formylglycine-generating enzyme required for sulfatase activity